MMNATPDYARPSAATPRPLTANEQTMLSQTFTDVCALHGLCVSGSAVSSVWVERGESYSCADGRMLLSDLHLRLVTDALASFFEELRSSPTEIEVVTGSPPSKTAEPIRTKLTPINIRCFMVTLLGLHSRSA